MNYTDYLQAKKLSPSTIHTYGKYSQKFITWLAADNLTPDTFTYNDLLAYMQYCSAQGITKGSVHGILNVIRHYCNYLIHIKSRTDNPAAGVFIKGLVRKIPVHILSPETLEQLYQQYSIQLHVDAPKKIMLGLLIYQGLTVDEIIRLQKQHIKLNEGKVLIKGTKRTNERWLSLQAVQIPALQGYLAANKFKEGPLFAEKKKGAISPQNISNQVQWMFKQLRQLNPGVINAQQIRSSVLTHWLKKNSLREVQYMAGHKYVSSTERYQVNNLDDLQNELQQHHPLK
jgi:site-specific recombinase XerD